MNFSNHPVPLERLALLSCPPLSILGAGVTVHGCFEVQL